MILGRVEWLAVLRPDEQTGVVDLDEVVLSLLGSEIGDPLLFESRARALREFEILAGSVVEPL
jgi:hypothetical protein